MPSSPLLTTVGIMKAIHEIQPKSVLDIGVGFGKYGFLIRQYLDLRPGKQGGYARWSIKLDGIEIHDRYLTPVHEYIYDTVTIGNALEILAENRQYYDLILLSDVIEHFTKSDGQELLEQCKVRSDRAAIVSTPYLYYEQGEEYKNTCEKHLSGWDVEDFRSLGAKYIWKQGISVVAVFTEETYDLPLAEGFGDEDLSPLDLRNIRKLADLYFETEQFEDCIKLCQKYATYAKHDYELPLLTALCYEKLNKPEKAREYAEKVLAINSSVLLALKILERSGK